MIGTLVLLSSLYGFGQTPPVVYISPQSAVAWNQVVTDVAGLPRTITGYELAVAPSGSDLNLAIDQPIRKIGTSADGYKGTPMGTLLGGLPQGPHRLQARAVDEASLWSAWGAPLDVVITTVVPSAPSGLRVITVTVTVQ